MSEISKAKAAKERQAEIGRVLDILHRWGIESLGQFAALEKEAVAARLGPIGVQLWERATGKTTRLLKLVPVRESFEEAFEFENEIETSEPLLFMLRRFLQQFSVRLGALHLVASELQLEITFSDKSSYSHRFKIPEPTNTVEILFRMLHTHLENFTSKSPIIAVALKAETTKPSFEQFHLFETALRDPARLTETLARLAGLLGSERVGTPGARRNASARCVPDGAVLVAIAGNKIGAAAVARVRFAPVSLAAAGVGVARKKTARPFSQRENPGRRARGKRTLQGVGKLVGRTGVGPRRVGRGAGKRRRLPMSFERWPVGARRNL